MELNFVCNFYIIDISRRDFEVQLEIFKIDLNVGLDEVFVKVVVNYLVEGNKQVLFSEIVIIVCFILVMFVINVVSERLFSNLWRLKIYFRFRMFQERLNSLMILYMQLYKEEIDKLDLVVVVNEFVQKKEY